VIRVQALGLFARLAVATLSGFVLATSAAHARSPRSSDRPRVPASARELIRVSSPTASPANYLARIEVFRRSGPKARWRRVLGPWPAETGYGHLRRHRQEGDGSTPIGVFGIGPTMYGNRPDPRGLHFAYHHLVCGDWWDEDPYSPQYNEFVHARCRTRPAFASRSEALWTEKRAYPYFAVVQFNTHPVRGGAGAPGSGIFLHSWVGGPTAGCVALRPYDLLRVLRWLVPSDHPVIEISVRRGDENK